MVQLLGYQAAVNAGCVFLLFQDIYARVPELREKFLSTYKGMSVTEIDDLQK